MDWVTHDGWTPLHSAARWDQAEIASLLISQGADVNQKTNGGLTAIQLAVSEKGYEKVISVLLAGSYANYLFDNDFALECLNCFVVGRKYFTPKWKIQLSYKVFCFFLIHFVDKWVKERFII